MNAVEAGQQYLGAIVGGRYRVERFVGQGGMGSVWAGRHVTLDQLVAIKFIHPRLANSMDALRRFDVEARAAARIKSRHIVAVFDHGITEHGHPYIVMEYLEGESLEQTIRSRGAIPLPEVVEIISQAARALHVAHAAGVLHRDLKPDNIFLTRDAEARRFGYTVKLLDFGIAKIVHEQAANGAATTQAGTVLGTPHYMAPESLTSTAEASTASDIWSLGACAFAAACGRVPFEGDAIGDVVLKVCSAPLPVPSRIQPMLPKAFDHWFATACARNPKHRFGNMLALSDALLQLDEWANREREASLYEIRPLQSGEFELQEPGLSTKGKVIGGVLAGMAVMLAALGAFVFEKTRRAEEHMAAVAASAQAIIEAENQRKLRAAQEELELAKRRIQPGTETDAGVTAKRKRRQKQ